MGRIEEELAYLEYVKELIGKEIEEGLKTLERIPHDYKGRYAQVKWGDEDLVENLTNMYIRRIEILEGLENNPYFGSFDFETDKNRTFYIGKTDIHDKSGLCVLDWRNPICTLYYDKSNGVVSYDSPSGIITGLLNRKSQIRIKGGKLLDIKDVDLVTDDELLAPYLDVSADNRMKTIIASIQSEQNEIIRRSVTKNLIIQGVAGSGKTSVALHRIAYLLYNQGREFDPSKFVVIGPNKYFLNYISKVLPDLDTKGISEFTFEELIKSIINDEKITIETKTEELSKFMKDKKNKEFSLKGTLDYKKGINKFLCDYFDETIKGGIVIEGVTLVSEEELRSYIKPNFGNIKNVNDAIKVISKRIKDTFEDIYYPLTRPLMEEMKKYPLRSKERMEIIAKMDSIKVVIEKGALNELKKKLKPLLISPVNLYKIFLSSLDSYFDLTEEEIKYYKNESLKNIGKKKVGASDLAGFLYITMFQNGLSHFYKYRHVVIDEAQDYSLFEFDILKALFNKSTFSIFGDIAQSIYPHRTINSWNEVNETIFDSKADIIEMTKSYRTTRQITLEANGVLGYLNLSYANPVIRDGKEVFITSSDVIDKKLYYKALLDMYNEENYNSIGIICKDESEMEEVANLLDELNIKYNKITSSDTEYYGGINILTSYLSKGLEFDAVIINDASQKKYNTELDMHLLYVALTRAIHKLDIMYSNTLTKVLSDEKVRVNRKILIKK